MRVVLNYTSINKSKVPTEDLIYESFSSLEITQLTSDVDILFNEFSLMSSLIPWQSFLEKF